MKPLALSSVERTKPADALPTRLSQQSRKPRFTGRRMIMMRPGVKASAVLKKMSNKSSLRIANIRDFSSNIHNFHQAFNQADGIYFDSFNVAIVNEGNEAQVKSLEEPKSGSADIISNEPERFVYALPGRKTRIITVRKDKTLADAQKNFTWGVDAVNVLSSKLTGKSVNIAVLDTGLNFAHPDFKGLNIQHRSFIKTQQVEDLQGHGTHCSGIAVGAINKSTGMRYGVAFGANLFIGKVLSNQGSGNDAGILAGIEWALQNKCRVISMSLGSEVGAGESFSPAYERVAKTAIQNNCLIVAAAGNESERQFGIIKPVGHPANCPSILAVAALDHDFSVAPFSCGGINMDGGQVDVAAPGVNIYSSWKSKSYKSISGTSMATPFVAGIAALYWQEFPKSKPADIWMKIVQNARRLELKSSDVGSGLVQIK